MRETLRFSRRVNIFEYGSRVFTGHAGTLGSVAGILETSTDTLETGAGTDGACGARNCIGFVEFDVDYGSFGNKEARFKIVANSSRALLVVSPALRDKVVVDGGIVRSVMISVAA